MFVRTDVRIHSFTQRLGGKWNALNALPPGSTIIYNLTNTARSQAVQATKKAAGKAARELQG